MDVVPAAGPTAAATHFALPTPHSPHTPHTLRHPSSLTRAALGALSALALSASTLLSPASTAHADVYADVTANVNANVNADVSFSLEAPAPLLESGFEQAVVDLVNHDRQANGMAPLDFDPALLATARQRALDQVPQPALNHYDAAGQLAFVKLLSSDGVNYQLAGENLARLYGLDDGTAGRAEDALMHSPTHRANILEPTFNRLAVGATRDSQGRVILAQIFRAN